VHYTVEDLSDPDYTASTNNLVYPIRPATRIPASPYLGVMNKRHRPWGGYPLRSGGGGTSAVATDYSMSLKDPGVRTSDEWDFPTNKFASLGAIGRVHRGTPWQTIYLKSTVEQPRTWLEWSGSLGTHPTNDWKFADLFTVAANDNAARGLLSVNQTNIAAWSAVLSGVTALSNSVGGVSAQTFIISPNTPQLRTIVQGINTARARKSDRLFRNLGDLLATPELTVNSPFVNRTNLVKNLNDAVVERIPQQILSLLKADEPRIVVYAFGQSLKPAERSLVTLGKFYNVCTNYQITGEMVSKTVMRIEDAPEKPRVVVESYSIVSPD
jgi:hypothetical protein